MGGHRGPYCDGNDDGDDDMETTPYECEGWSVIESRENVPAGHYEVRDPAGRRYGIWESVAAAVRHLHETKDAPPEDRDWIEEWAAGPDD